MSAPNATHKKAKNVSSKQIKKKKKRQTDLFAPNGIHAPCASVCKKNWNVRKLIEKTGSFGKWLK